MYTRIALACLMSLHISSMHGFFASRMMHSAEVHIQRLAALFPVQSKAYHELQEAFMQAQNARTCYERAHAHRDGECHEIEHARNNVSVCRRALQEKYAKLEDVSKQVDALLAQSATHTCAHGTTLKVRFDMQETNNSPAIEQTQKRELLAHVAQFLGLSSSQPS